MVFWYLLGVLLLRWMKPTASRVFVKPQQVLFISTSVFILGDDIYIVNKKSMFQE